MTQSQHAQLSAYAKSGSGLRPSTQEITLWSKRVRAFLAACGDPDDQVRFDNLGSLNDPETQAMRLGYVEGLIAKSEGMTNGGMQLVSSSAPAEISQRPQTVSSRRVFVVHGHDNEAKETTARFLEKLGLEATILHEQPNAGRTIIEKFEVYSGDVAFAVILLTGDDVGSAAGAPSLQKRARQNVILELGYFIGRLGRPRVCALHRGDIELPSDYQGVLYIQFDASGAWKTKLAQELVQAKVVIKVDALLAM